MMLRWWVSMKVARIKEKIKRWNQVHRHKRGVRHVVNEKTPLNLSLCFYLPPGQTKIRETWNGFFYSRWRNCSPLTLMWMFLIFILHLKRRFSVYKGGYEFTRGKKEAPTSQQQFIFASCRETSSVIHFCLYPIKPLTSQRDYPCTMKTKAIKIRINKKYDNNRKRQLKNSVLHGDSLTQMSPNSCGNERYTIFLQLIGFFVTWDTNFSSNNCNDCLTR